MTFSGCVYYNTFSWNSHGFKWLNSIIIWKTNALVYVAAYDDDGLQCFPRPLNLYWVWKSSCYFFFLTNHTHKTIVCVLLVNEKLWVWLPLCKQTYFLSPDLVKPLTATVFQFGFCVSCDARQFHMANASMTALSFMSRMCFPKCHLKMIWVDGVNTLFFSPITPSC